MPVAAAAILQRIADFLAVGASPTASTEAGDGFSVLLARNAPTPAPATTGETGTTLPLDRQDLAAQPTELPATGLDLLDTNAAEGDATPAAPPSADLLPSTAAILIAADALPRTVVATTTFERQDAPAQDDAAAPRASAKAKVAEPSNSDVRQADVPPPGERLVAPTSVNVQSAADETVPSQPTVRPAIVSPKSVTSHRQASNARAHAPVSTEAETSVETPVVLAATTTPPAARLPDTADVQIKPAAAPKIIAEAPDAPVFADNAAPQPQTDAKPRLARSNHHSDRPAKTEGSREDAAPIDERVATMPPPIVTTAIDTLAVPTTDPLQPTPAAPAVAASIAASLPQTIIPESAAPPARSAEMPAARVDTATAALPTVDQPTSAITAQTQPATTTVIETTPAPMPSGVIFVARSTRPITARTPVPQPTDSAAPAIKVETVAPVAAHASATADREVVPFRTSTMQLLAAQPASIDAPRASEVEARVPAPVAETTPTIAQHLAPLGHGSERIVAAAFPSPTTALSTEQAAALVETIQMLRSEAKSDAMTLAVDHDELGKITMRFDRTDHGIAVRIDSPDPGVNQLIANSAPALRSSGDGVGMRFDRQDTLSSGTGTSRDAPRQGAGQDRNSTPHAQSSRPRASGQRDGLFA